MGRLKWFGRFLTNEIVAQNRFLTRRRRKNRFLRLIKEITSTMGLSPEFNPLFLERDQSPIKRRISKIPPKSTLGKLNVGTASTVR